MRSISPIIAIVILLLMTVAAGGMAYITITTFQQTTQAQGAGGVQQLGQQAGTILKVESVTGGTVYIRNIGTTDVSKVKVYADGKEVGACDAVEQGEYCIIQINQTVDCGSDQRCDLTIGAATPPTVTGELSVNEEELQGTACGDGACSAAETSLSCWEDCGGNFSLQTNTTLAIVTGDMNFFTSMDVADVNTTTPGQEIITGGYTYYTELSDVRIFQMNSSGELNSVANVSWGIEDAPFALTKPTLAADVADDTGMEIVSVGYFGTYGDMWGDLRVFNITNGDLALKTNASWQMYADNDTVIASVKAGNIDSDPSLEIITGGYFTNTPPNNWADLRVFNVSDDELKLETNTSFQIESLSTTIASIFLKDIDGDNKQEIFTAIDHGGAPPTDLAIYVFEINSTGELDEIMNTTWTPPTPVFATSILVGDVDMDNQQEIAVFYIGMAASFSANLDIFEIQGNQIVPQANTSWYDLTTDVPPFPYMDLELADPDEDGRPEIIWPGYNVTGAAPNTKGILKLFEVDDNQIIEQTIEIWGGFATSAASTKTIDIDSDGKLEVISVGVNGGPAEVRVYEVH